jgi:hypothetical protein
MTKHLLSSDKHHFSVVNRSLLKKQLESIVCAHKYDIVVVDEAHQLQSFSSINPWSGAVPILFVTASPKESCLDLYDVLYGMKEVSVKKARYTTYDVSFCVEKNTAGHERAGSGEAQNDCIKKSLERSRRILLLCC